MVSECVMWVKERIGGERGGKGYGRVGGWGWERGGRVGGKRTWGWERGGRRGGKEHGSEGGNAAVWEEENVGRCV